MGIRFCNRLQGRVRNITSGVDFGHGSERQGHRHNTCTFMIRSELYKCENLELSFFKKSEIRAVADSGLSTLLPHFSANYRDY